MSTELAIQNRISLREEKISNFFFSEFKHKKFIDFELNFELLHRTSTLALVEHVKSHAIANFSHGNGWKNTLISNNNYFMWFHNRYQWRHFVCAMEQENSHDGGETTPLAVSDILRCANFFPFLSSDSVHARIFLNTCHEWQTRVFG